MEEQYRIRAIETLRLIKDRHALLDYQRKAPTVSVANEMFNQWEECYLPDEARFREQFSPSELLALERFDSVMDSVARRTPQELPNIVEFVKTEHWVELAAAAVEALLSFSRGFAGGA